MNPADDRHTDNDLHMLYAIAMGQIKRLI